MPSAPPDLYLNMQQFSELKLQARQDSADASKAAAQQFEGLFVQMMLKNMRSAATMDESQHSSTMDFYTEMYDKQLSLILSQQGGIGIADLLQSQLGGQSSERKPAAAAMGLKLPLYRLPVQVNKTLPMPEMNYEAKNPAVKIHALTDSVEAVDSRSKVEASQIQSQTLSPFYGWENAKSFVHDLWPHAEKAASKLGVSAQLLVAQSALETGWGQHAMKKPDGQIAFNLFGIKAGEDWTGQSVVQQTVEYRQGSMQQEKARFRSYDSVAESLGDYVSFVKSRPRYQQALLHGGSDARYIQGLHKAGYATDPAYASKVMNIMRGQTFNDALAALQTTQQLA